MSETLPQNPTAAVDQPQTPADFLSALPNAPSKVRIEEWKTSVPGNRVKLFVTSDGKQAFILRGLSGLEMSKINAKAQPNADNPEYELALAACELAVLWTNTTRDGKIDDLALRKGPAGIPGSLFKLISELSGFYEPQELQVLSGDL
jgi:hypothetical protein